MSPTAYRAALIRKVEKEMDRVEAAGYDRPNDDIYGHYPDGLVDGQLQGLSHVLWLIKDTEDL